MLNITIGTTEYELATTLRVAYLVQGQNNHKSYVELFQEIDKMTLEQQVGIVYAAFVAANPDQKKTITQNDFFEYFLDNYTISELMKYVSKIIEGIMGKKLEEEEEVESASFLAGTDCSDKDSNVD